MNDGTTRGGKSDEVFLSLEYDVLPDTYECGHCHKLQVPSPD